MMKSRPRKLLAASVALLSVFTFAAHTSAQKKERETKVVTYATTLRAQAGESEKAIIDLPLGTEVEVIDRKGRWVHVRVNSKRGWVPRTTIGVKEGVERSDDTKDEKTKAADDDSEDTNSWDGDKIKIDDASKSTDPIELVAIRRTKARYDPSKKADEAFEVNPDDPLWLTARRGTKWVQVMNEDGATGWVRASVVETKSGKQNLSDARTEELDPSEFSDEMDPFVEEQMGPNHARKRLSKRGLQLSAQASIGLSSYARSFRSDGESALGGYRINAGTMAAAIDAGAVIHFGNFFVGAKSSFSTNIGAPGIRFQDEDGEVSDPNGFKVHRLGAAIELGATLGRAHPIRVAAVGGYDLDYFVISQIQKNPGLLAREKTAGLNVGVDASTFVSRHILVGAKVHWTPKATLAQTTNLEDGMDSKVWSVSGGARASYFLDSRHTIEASYLGRRVEYKFTGQSTRQFDVTKAFRKDLYHSLMVGAARAF